MLHVHCACILRQIVCTLKPKSINILKMYAALKKNRAHKIQISQMVFNAAKNYYSFCPLNHCNIQQFQAEKNKIMTHNKTKQKNH